MQAREDALRRHFAHQPCKVCQNRQVPESLFVLVRRAQTWVVMASCANCHHRGIFVVAFPKAARSTPTTLDPTPRVTTRDVIEMHGFLEHFDGDFLSLFGQGPHGHLATD
jgi:hypothetical protein